MSSIQRNFLIVMFLGLLLSGCFLSNEQNGSGFQENDKVFSTASITPSLIPSKVVEIIPPDHAQTETPVPTATETAIPIPTIKFVSEDFVIDEIIMNNNSCDYPCFWGIIPGVTTWDIAEEFLLSFSENIIFRENTLLEADGGQYSANVPVPKEIDTDGIETIAFNINKDRVIQSIYTVINNVPRNRLSEILSEYGVPSDVYIWVYGSDHVIPGDEFRLAVFYKDKGITLIYYGKSDMTNETISICPSQFDDKYVTLKLWNASNQYTFQEIGESGILEGGLLEYRSLQDISDLSIEEFFDRYRFFENAITCFEIVNLDI